MYNKKAFYKQWSKHQSDKSRNHCGAARRQSLKQHANTNGQNPPANVLALDDKYELHLFAPGYEKPDFLIAVIDQTLRISVKEKVNEEANWKRKEYSPNGFERHFELNEKIDKAAIGAKYENGVLILSLPKMEGFETARQKIVVD